MSSTKVEISLVGAVIFFFFLLWTQGGWYRIDCALSVQKACALVEDEYVKKARP